MAKLSSITKHYSGNKKLEQEGKWERFYVRAEDDTELGSFLLKIAYAGETNQRYARSLERVTRQYRTGGRIIDLPDELANEILLEVFVDSIISDWDDVMDEEGNPVPFTKEGITTLLKSAPHLFPEVRMRASNRSVFREDLDGEVKNS